MEGKNDVPSSDKICVHCKKNVVTCLECLRCGKIFHPACMNQANEAKNKQCRHIDVRGLAKEVESQNKTILKLNNKINILEETIKKLMEKSENQQLQESPSLNNPIMEINKKIEEMEQDIEYLKTKPPMLVLSSETVTEVDEISENSKQGRDDDLLTTINGALKDQSEQIAIKLDGIVQAIKSTNKELVEFLTQNITKSSPVTKTPLQEKKLLNITNANPAKELMQTRPTIANGISASSSATINQTSISNQIQSMVKGTGRVLDITAAAERKWYYVGNLHPDCTEERLKDHLIKNDIDLSSCEKLNSQFDHKVAFKISFEPQLEKLVLNSDLWPLNVVVKPFSFRPMGRRFNGMNTSQNFRRGFNRNQRN
ncbi:uncharacterized protein LOC126748003 [Anthonomus grandis grandis]|uniref:uncharacterized protein LOC126748003 n=1 Tax=Anthonomus grandis grandis TaxID=2921223 RepID=UPI0021656809|nr:uncharacterized protein LOC126748003 [Anthonomus grandis grandis]XP_050312963.1 uncharacterized protein LOC126748003 [Anthonomus grandis grandis]XP_050312964.1 uncharacterized protein LOC126748003 [Anthonomus grandis grandis]